MKKLNYKTIATLLLTSILIGGLSALAFSIGDINNNFIQSTENDSDLNTSVKENGISVQFLSSKINDDKSVTKTFTYSITPENATNQNVTVEAKYNDNTNCDDVLTASVDISSKTISLVCKADFEKQIYVTITSSSDFSKTAQITVDYVKKVKSIDYKLGDSDSDSDYWYTGCGMQVNAGFRDSFAFNDLLDVTYSKFTKDKKYTFNVKDVTLIDDELMCGDCSSFETELRTNFTNALKTKITNLSDTYFNDDEIWNFSTSNKYHSIISQFNDDSYRYEEQGYICYKFKASYYCVEDPTIELKIDKYWQFSLISPSGFLGKTINVDEINTQTKNIEF